MMGDDSNTGKTTALILLAFTGVMMISLFIYAYVAA